MSKSFSVTLATAALGVICGLLSMPSCSSPFKSCITTRTCPRAAGGIGSAGEAGAPSDQAPASGDGGATEAQAGEGGETATGGAGSSGSEADGGEAGSEVGAGGACQTCAKPDGAHCEANNECLSASCNEFFKDADGDTYGSSSFADTAMFCGTTPPVGYVDNAKDCCDSDKNAKPGQKLFFELSNNCSSFDYDCSAAQDLDPKQKYVSTEACDAPNKGCSATVGWVGVQQTKCGGDFYWRPGSCVYIASNGGFCSFNRVGQILRCH